MAVREADVVISTLNGPSMASLQLKLVDAIKEAGNVKVLIFFFFSSYFPVISDNCIYLFVCL
jgi:NmrA-like family